jgi:subtilisin-like proprotein convertase family protein
MAFTENAGWVVVSNWNNTATSGTSGSLGSLKQSDGVTTLASVSWTCSDFWSTPISEAPDDFRMMKGYLESAGASTNTVSVSGLSAAYTSGGYDVYVYFDGDNSVNRLGYYSIGGTTVAATDYNDANFDGAFVFANNSAGNCVVFSGQSASNFTLQFFGNAADGASARAPVNGVQIVASVIDAPTGLTATCTNIQAYLTWNSTAGAISYNIKRATASGGPYTTIANTSSTTYTDSGLGSGVTYYYVVSAVSTVTESVNSSEASVSTTPNAPSSIAATATNTQAKISWPAAAGATSYKVKRSTTSGGSYSTISTVNSANYTNTGLPLGTTYYYVVSAVNAAGESQNSAETSVRLPLVVYSGGVAPNASIPDQNFNGYVSRITLDTGGDTNGIHGVNVKLNLTGGYNGDLFAYLVSPNNNTVTLLNRVGKTGGNLYGYSNAGMKVILSEVGMTTNLSGSIHTYQSVSGYDITSGTALWTPDNASGSFNVFHGGQANGTWTLFLADMEYGDVSTLLSWEVDVNINHPPLPGSMTLGAVVNEPQTLLTAKLTTRGADSDGDALTVSAVSSTSTNGGTVTLSGGVITYRSKTNSTAADAFSYTLTDGYGGTVTGSVLVNVSTASAGQSQLSIQPISGGNVRLTFLGVVGYKYALELTHSLGLPMTWTSLVTNTAGFNGLLIFTNTPSGGDDFYRTRYVP